MAVDHTAAIPIVGLSDQASTAVIVSLIFCSVWMGALGWEIFMTIPFDYRLVMETRWGSFMSSMHSIAYLLSRYATLTFIVLYVAANAVTAPAMDQEMCQRRVVASAIFFVISQSTIILVFVMRTLALWNLNARVVGLLTAAWLAMVGLELTMPIKAKGVLTDSFCTWKIDGFWVGASMTSLAIVSVLCMILTISKLNQRGWRGIVKSVLPRRTHSIDSEEVSAMLVQRTTIFSILLIIVIAVADVVYFSATIVVYQLMTVSAYLAIASSLAGRIFRRSWKLTRSSYYQRPPSYFPEWVSGDDMLLDAQSQSQSHTPRRFSADSLTFVEGEFRAGPGSSAKSLILPLREKDKTPAQLFADEHGRAQHEPGLPDAVLSEPSYDATLAGMPSQDTILRDHNLKAHGHEGASIYMRDFASHGVDGAPCPPTMLMRESSEKMTRISRGKSGSASRLVLPFGARENLKGSEKSRLQRPQTDPTTEQPSSPGEVIVNGWSVRPATSNSPGISPKQKIDSLYADEEADARRADAQPTTLARDDLVAGPSQPRLWLDSSAERARMEAAKSLGLTLASGTTAGDNANSKSPCSASFISSSHHSVTSSTDAACRDLASRRSMRRPSALSNGSLWENHGGWSVQRSREGSLGNTAAETSSPPTSRPSTGGQYRRTNARVGSPTEAYGVRRGSFLESPAILQAGAGVTNDRKAYDIDAIKQSFNTSSQQWLPSTSGRHSGRTGLSAVKSEESITRPSLSLPSSPHEEAHSSSSGAPPSSSSASQAKAVDKRVRGGSASVQTSLRPSTAPDNAASALVSSGDDRRGSAGAVGSGSVPLGEEEGDSVAPASDALAAFRQVVEGDNEHAARFMDAARPRTSRGGPLGAFGEVRRDSATSSNADADDNNGSGNAQASNGDLLRRATAGAAALTSTEHPRPTTSDGSQVPVKPFGSGNSVAAARSQLGSLVTSASPSSPPSPTRPAAEPVVSAIEQQYLKLAAYVDADDLAGEKKAAP